MSARRACGEEAVGDKEKTSRKRAMPSELSDRIGFSQMGEGDLKENFA
jgi:hypothetical protein